MPIDQKDVKEVAALKYSPHEGGAPKLVAVGKGEIAEQIITVAKEHNIPLYEDANLSRTLNLFNIGDEIPKELYEVVAQILIFVGDIDKSYGKRE